MENLRGKTALVTGGSRGIGRGIVAAFSAAGCKTWAIARNGEQLNTLRTEVNGVQTIAKDVADRDTAPGVIQDVAPDILVLNAGLAPKMKPVHEQSWDEFTAVWDNDVKSTFHFCKAALTAPLTKGSVVVIISSGAAISGSPLSGGYAGAKRMQWLLAKYCQQIANAKELGIRFLALLPKQMVGSTELGTSAASGYAKQMGVSIEAFLEKQAQGSGGVLLTPTVVGEAVVTLVTDPVYGDGLAYGITGGGLELLE